jgi:NADH:ubiquinone oxidoreductase subunit E
MGDWRFEDTIQKAANELSNQARVLFLYVYSMLHPYQLYSSQQKGIHHCQYC